MIELKKLNKYYKSGQGSFHALKDIDIVLPNTGLVYIVGKSGSGKSTLLNIIGGIDAFDNGELLINNINISSFSKKDYNSYRNTYIGFVFQEFNVVKGLTVYDNIALSLQLQNSKAKFFHYDIIDIINLVGLNGKENRRMNEISGGERQRVAIARALIKKPQMIIADEPTGNLDSKNRDIVMDILKNLSKERLVLVVTHDRELSRLYGDRIITIKDGSIIEDETINSDNLNYQNIEKNYNLHYEQELSSYNYRELQQNINEAKAFKKTIKRILNADIKNPLNKQNISELGNYALIENIEKFNISINIHKLRQKIIKLEKIIDDQIKSLDSNNKKTKIANIKHNLKTLKKYKLTEITIILNYYLSKKNEYRKLLKYQKNLNKQLNNDGKHQNTLEAISPNISTSFLLAWKSFLLNKTRFIFIILLFSCSLIFASCVSNLYFTNTTQEYAKFQNDYGNNIVSLSQEYNARDISKSNSGFFAYELSQYVNNYAKDNSGMKAFTSMKINIPINPNNNDSFYQNTIQNITQYERISDFQFIIQDRMNSRTFNCYITDYLASSLIKQGYFGSTNLTYADLINENDEPGKDRYITSPFFKDSLFIKGIIRTNFLEFENKISDQNYYAAFMDNLPYYNSIFVDKDTYSRLFSISNMPKYLDEIAYSGLGISSTASVYYTYYNSGFGGSHRLLNGSVPVRPKPGEPTQVAISSGLLKQLFKIDDPNSVTFNVGMHNSNGFVENFYFCGYSYIPSSMYCIITGIIDSDELVIYAPNASISSDDFSLYGGLIDTTFHSGGYLTMLTNANTSNNSQIYRNMLDNNIKINNISFLKLQLVDQFIKDNLIFFLGIFFIFCLFSTLMIFNFIIINIKNSSRDIGIYMSLGMNGLKIALIYFFQILIISTISALIAFIGSGIFLISIDVVFSTQSLVNFSIIKFSFIGILIVLAIAYLTPLIAIIFPLLNLSRKKPIDVIKVS